MKNFLFMFDKLLYIFLPNFPKAVVNLFSNDICKFMRYHYVFIRPNGHLMGYLPYVMLKVSIITLEE